MTESEYSRLLEGIYERFPSFQVVGDRAFKPGLDNMQAIDRLLCYPSKDFPSVHIAGTNGKGSVSHMIASALMQLPKENACSKGGTPPPAGTEAFCLQRNGKFRVGLYTSPHLVDFRERIKVDGEMISKEWVYNFLVRHMEVFEELNASFFEITTAMAFSYFSYCKVDVAVIECGLGGRLDSTNIIEPVVSVITNIGLDHTQYLGNTLKEIASEKAGIIKPDVPAVIGEAGDDGIRELFEAKAYENSSRIFFADRLNPFDLSPEGLCGCHSDGKADASISSATSLATCLLASVDISRMDLRGDCQKKNIKTVCMALAVAINRLCAESQGVSESNLGEIIWGIENAASITGLRGRWEKLCENPLIICDIGHNSHGMKVLMPQVERAYRERLAAFQSEKEADRPNLIMLFGVMKDKDLASEVDFLPKDAHYLYVNASTPRALPAAELKSAMEAHGFKGELPSEVVSEKNPAPDGSIPAALDWVKRNARVQDFVFIGGSSYVVAEVLENVQGCFFENFS